MVTIFIKSLVSVILTGVALILTVLWFLFGTILLFTLIIRLIALYTIALLNSFVSGNPILYDYTKAIEEVVDTYLNTYIKILRMPLMPWEEAVNQNENNLKKLLSTEMYELRKSWIITVVVFLTYTFSFGLGIAHLTFKENKNLKEKHFHELESATKQIQNLQNTKLEYKTIIEQKERNQLHAIKTLYVEKRYSVKSISRFLNIPYNKVEEVISEKNISR